MSDATTLAPRGNGLFECALKERDRAGVFEAHLERARPEGTVGEPLVPAACLGEARPLRLEAAEYHSPHESPRSDRPQALDEADHAAEAGQTSCRQ